MLDAAVSVGAFLVGLPLRLQQHYAQDDSLPEEAVLQLPALGSVLSLLVPFAVCQATTVDWRDLGASLRRQRGLVLLWVLSLLLSPWSARVYMVVWLLSSACRDQTPLREALRCLEVYLHFSALGIPFTVAPILRCALTGTVRDVQRLAADGSKGRLTMPMHPHYRKLYPMAVAVCALLLPVPHYATAAYLAIAVGLHLKAPPALLSALWGANYLVELWFRQQIQFDYRYDHRYD